MKKLLKKSSKNLEKNSSKFVKKFIKVIEKMIKIFEKSHQKNLPGLAKKYFFPIKLKISTNLFSIKIKKKFFFLGLGEKKSQKIENLKTGEQDWTVRSSQIFGRTNFRIFRDIKTTFDISCPFRLDARSITNGERPRVRARAGAKISIIIYAKKFFFFFFN